MKKLNMLCFVGLGAVMGGVRVINVEIYCDNVLAICRSMAYDRKRHHDTSDSQSYVDTADSRLAKESRVMFSQSQSSMMSDVTRGPGDQLLLRNPARPTTAPTPQQTTPDAQHTRCTEQTVSTNSR